MECCSKKSAEFTSCTVLEEPSDGICALDRLEIVDTDMFTVQTALHPVTWICRRAQRCLGKSWEQRGNLKPDVGDKLSSQQEHH